MRLSSPLRTLLRNPVLFDSRASGIDQHNTIQVFDPSRNFTVGTVVGETFNPTSSKEAAQVATDAANKANEYFHKTWSHTTAAARGSILLKIAALQREHINDLGTILAVEAGKPIREAMGEIEYAAGYFQFFGEEARRNYGKLIPSPIPNRELKAWREPVGTCFLSTPFNFPAAMLSRKLSAALAAGCTTVCRPSESVPLSTVALRIIATEAGLPEEAFMVIPSSHEHADAVTDALCTSPQIAKISFTGSTKVGKTLASKCAPYLKRVSLELGGNAPFIVFEDANLEAAVTGLLQAKLRFSGQACVAANRVFVHENRVEDFVHEYTRRASKLRLGPSLDPATDLGPLIHTRAYDKVMDLLRDGGKKVGGGGDGGKKLDGTFVHPQLVLDVGVNHRVVREEVFGPVAGVLPFRDENDVIAMANATQAGLAGYIFTQDLARAGRVSRALKIGMIGVNTGMVSSELIPFGGVKDSGMGREGSWLGLDDYSDWKHVAVQEVS